MCADCKNYGIILIKIFRLCFCIQFYIYIQLWQNFFIICNRS